MKVPIEVLSVHLLAIPGSSSSSSNQRIYGNGLRAPFGLRGSVWARGGEGAGKGRGRVAGVRGVRI